MLHCPYMLKLNFEHPNGKELHRSSLMKTLKLILQEELSICKTIDPWAGSFYVENLTNKLVEKALSHIDEIENAWA